MSVDAARAMFSGEVVDWARSKPLLPSTVQIADALYDGGRFTTPVSCKELFGLKDCCPALAVDDEWKSTLTVGYMGALMVTAITEEDERDPDRSLTRTATLS
jgi:hypothetical protein